MTAFKLGCYGVSRREAGDMTQRRQAIARMWSSYVGDLRSFAGRIRCVRGFLRNCGPLRPWRRDGIEATAQALDVDRPSLQKWTNRFEPRAEAKPREPRRQRQSKREPAAAAFVELLAGNTGATASCLVEVESPRGAKLRLELKAIPTSALAELIRAFAAS